MSLGIAGLALALTQSSAFILYVELFVTESVHHMVRAGLASFLAVAMLSACDDRLPSSATELPTKTSAQVNTPESLPSDIPTSTPVPTLAPEPTATTPSSTSKPTPTQVPTATPASELTPTPALLITVSNIPKELPPYDRDDWRHWTDEDDDCQNTRHEVLIAESQAAVTFKSDRQCQVDGGQWFGVFTATAVKEASKLDIDHLVPLANAHRSGGWDWTDEKKEQYANSLDHPDHLIAVTAGANRSKGAKGPDEWRPPNESHWCEYAVSWIRVKQTWDLTATPAEAEALQDMLATCANPPRPTVKAGGPAPDSGSPTRSSPAGDTYSSCDEAAEAGEQRVQGSKGPGRGFPELKVPSARDGDGDGVVCEK